MMELKPLDDRVVVERLEEEETRKGRIIIPDTAKEKPRVGKVVAVGTDEDLQDKVKVGDRILYGKYVGDEVELEGKEYLIVQRQDILAIVVGWTRWEGGHPCARLLLEVTEANRPSVEERMEKQEPFFVFPQSIVLLSLSIVVQLHMLVIYQDQMIFLQDVILQIMDIRVEEL